jgi:hypothetical protein
VKYAHPGTFAMLGSWGFGLHSISHLFSSLIYRALRYSCRSWSNCHSVKPGAFMLEDKQPTTQIRNEYSWRSPTTLVRGYGAEWGQEESRGDSAGYKYRPAARQGNLLPIGGKSERRIATVLRQRGRRTRMQTRRGNGLVDPRHKTGP